MTGKNPLFLEYRDEVEPGFQNKVPRPYLHILYWKRFQCCMAASLYIHERLRPLHILIVHQDELQ